MGNDLRTLESVEFLYQGTTGGGIVEIDHPHRHILWQSFVHQRSEEHHRQQRKDDHAEEVNAIHIQNLAFTPRYSQD
jgi:hypothetical protein